MTMFAAAHPVPSHSVNYIIVSLAMQVLDDMYASDKVSVAVQ